MADKHAVIRTDLMAGTEDYGQLKSAKFYSGSDMVAIDNGNIVVLDGLVESEREIFKAVAPTATSKPSQLYVTAGVVLFYDESVRHYEDEWVNEAGKATRLYKLHDGDIFSVTADAFETAPTVGQFVEFTATETTMKGAAVASATSFGKIVAIEKAARYTYYVIEVSDVAVSA